jgi:hypothetical protein
MATVFKGEQDSIMEQFNKEQDVVDAKLKTSE